MKRAFLFIPLLAASLSAQAQLADPVIFKLWKVGKEKTVAGHQLTKVEGNPMGALTNISFHSKKDMVADMDRRASAEMWSPEKKQEQAAMIENTAGMVMLYVMRSTITAAKTDNFTIIVQGTDEKELYREEMKGNVPSPTSGYWSSTSGIEIKDVELPAEFFVYVIDEMDSKHPRTKFLVKQ